MNYAFYPGCAYAGAAGYRESVEAVCLEIGLNLTAVNEWNCCGATSFFSLDHAQALALVARNMALAKKQGFDELVTICNACFTTLKKGGRILAEDASALDQVNEALSGEGLSLESPVRVRHLLEVMAEDVPAAIWAEKRIDHNQIQETNLKPAVYYGCQLTRPWQEGAKAQRPDILETLVESLGLAPIRHSAGTMCCGAALGPLYADECRPLIKRIIKGARSAGANILATVCPLCQFNLDSGQRAAGVEPTPILFFTQLMGMAMGLPADKLGINKLLTPMKGGG